MNLTYGQENNQIKQLIRMITLSQRSKQPSRLKLPCAVPFAFLPWKAYNFEPLCHDFNFEEKVTCLYESLFLLQSTTLEGNCDKLAIYPSLVLAHQNHNSTSAYNSAPCLSPFHIQQRHLTVPSSSNVYPHCHMLCYYHLKGY